jgi:hypothetical protein
LMMLRRKRVLGLGLLAGVLLQISRKQCCCCMTHFVCLNASKPSAEYLIELSFASLAKRLATKSSSSIISSSGMAKEH